METNLEPPARHWRVCVTRDEGPHGPLTAALRDYGFTPVSCPVLVEGEPGDPDALRRAAAHLDRYDWLVCASARAVRAIAGARTAPWPASVRTAAVGRRTAAALIEAGAGTPPVVADADGADGLLDALTRGHPWTGRRVLLPTTPGGRHTLIDGLRSAGAVVDVVEAYRMHPRNPHDIATDWTAAAPDAVIVGSPRAASLLAAAVGPGAIGRLEVVLAIGASTTEALQALGIDAAAPATADFRAAVRTLAGLHDRVQPA